MMGSLAAKAKMLLTVYGKQPRKLDYYDHSRSAPLPFGAISTATQKCKGPPGFFGFKKDPFSIWAAHQPESTASLRNNPGILQSWLEWRI